jgi:hypothetical protein
MLRSCATLADRLLELVVPRTTAGACPCGDSYCTTSVCDHDWEGNELLWRHYTNCNCRLVRKTCDCY